MKEIFGKNKIYHCDECDSATRQSSKKAWTATLPMVARSDEKRKYGFTLLVKHFRENPLFAKLTQTLTRFSQTKFRSVAAHSYGFTLAELITVIVLLGIVAAVTIPSTIKKHTETIKRTKIKKALETYNAVIQKMVVEHRFKTTQALDDWAAGPDGKCGNAKAYFNIAQTSGGCMFKTHDGLWWYIDSGDDKYDMYKTGDKLGPKKVSMSKAIVSFDLQTNDDKIKAKNVDVKTLLFRKASNTNWLGTFFFITTFDDNGALRIMDLAYGLNNFDWGQISPSIKVYGFINKRKFWNYLPLTDDNTKCNGTEGHRNCCLDQKDVAGQMLCYDNTGAFVQLKKSCNSGELYEEVDKKKKIYTIAMCGFRYYGLRLNASEMCKDEYDTTGFCYAYKTALSSFKELFKDNFDVNDFVIDYSPRCDNALSDGCIRGTVSFNMTDKCKNNSDCIGKYKPNGDVITLAGVNINQLSSFSMHSYECTETIQNNTCSINTPDTYSYQSDQKQWTFKDSSGKETRIKQRIDSKSKEPVYYIEKPGKKPRRCPSSISSYDSCLCCVYDAHGDCINAECD